MSSVLPKLYLARHGDTAWTDSHQVVAGLRRAGFTGGRLERGDALRLNEVALPGEDYHGPGSDRRPTRSHD
jgi:hypothetical protein